MNPRRSLSPFWLALAVSAGLVWACSGSAFPGSGGEAAGPTVPASPPPSATSTTPGADLGSASLSPTAKKIASLEQTLASNPNSGDTLLELGLALLQRVRETADPSLYPRAEEALDRARDLAPDDPLPVIGLGTLALARHQFAQGLALGRRALSLGPRVSTAQGVVVDALVELGRYPEALDAAQAMVDERPDLASFARVSYLRELYGDLPGALDAMQRAVQAGGSASENNAYVIVLYGNLLALSGRRPEAAQAYAAALAADPGFPAALAGQGRLAVAGGDLATAQARFARAAAIVPLPEYVIALGEAQEAGGDPKAAADSYALARAETALFQANGVVVDLELALFEADHGNAATALGLAQAAYADRPTLRAADALAWALFKNGRLAEARTRSAEALRLGTRDPVLLYHAGVIAAAAGDKASVLSDLRAALTLDPGFSATAAMAARELLTSLGG